MNTYAIDFETYYDDTIGFEANGNCGYVENPRFNAYMVSVSGSDGFRWTGHPSKLDWSMFDGQRCLAHNASFDEAVYNRHFHTGTGPAEWHCTADLAAFSGYPRALAGVMQQKYGKTRDKSIRDKMKGINPEVSANDPVNLAYAQEDADDCLRIWQDLGSAWPLIERRISYLTRRMGWIGIQLDMKYVEECCKKLGDQYAEIVATIPWANNAKINSRPALFQFLRDCGIPVPASTNRNDEAFQNWLEEYSAAPDASEHMKVVRNIANLRSINKTLNQFKTLRARAREDESFPYSKFYYGAHTGRFAGAGGFNMENLNREDKFGTNLRRAFVPRPGYSFIIADYSQIEPRCIFPGTPVLTEAGYKKAIDLTRVDLVWDGQDFVHHAGVIFKEGEATHVVNKSRCTADHFVYTGSRTGAAAEAVSEAEAFSHRDPSWREIWQLARFVGQEARGAFCDVLLRLWNGAACRLFRPAARSLNPVLPLRQEAYETHEAPQTLRAGLQ